MQCINAALIPNPTKINQKKFQMQKKLAFALNESLILCNADKKSVTRETDCNGSPPLAVNRETRYAPPYSRLFSLNHDNPRTKIQVILLLS